jgi:heme/copper-type cytochrome/quinol oxidase subunit 2
MGKQIRRIGSILILAGVVAWVTLSYLPAVALPQLRFPHSWSGQAFPALAVAGLILFVGLQIWLVQSTAASVRRYRSHADGAAPNSPFSISLGREVILTALPIAFVILLAVASFA